MLTIDRIRLHLPPGFERRGERIAHLIGEQLADYPVETTRHLERLALPAMEVSPNWSDRRVAGLIAGHIVRHIQTGGATHA